ncbi:MAG TPA: metal ABC transporter permease [Candidatus Paceibacterota bacterium]|nr:metal ABC transporter permease [Candidatus Paceibacterota bacterium]HMO82585.1 metal ABC transporter permease [Candidatus Paceibacterota bacterium]
MDILAFLIEPLQYAFMVKAVLVSTIVGVACAILSCFLVLKGWSLLGDAISHAVLPGVVLAYMIGIPFGIGAFVFAMLSVVLIGYIKNNTKIKEDAVMGIVFTTLFALGLVLISKIISSVDLTHVLFGEVLGISNSDAWFTFGILSLSTLVILLFRRTFLIFCFDPIHAQSLGLPVRLIHYTFLSLLAVTITGSIQTVGIILVIAMLITPGSTAFLLTKKFSTMLQIAVAVSVGSSLIGAYSSYYFNITTGGTIVFVQGCIFLSVFFYQNIKSRFAPQIATVKEGI